MTDIIDRIDALIDEQLAAGEPENGYDYGDPDYPECPHCGCDWHGLPRTRTQFGVYDEDGNHKTTVLCEGSDFIGPIRPRQPWATHAWPEVIFRIVVDTTATAESLRQFRERMGEITRAMLTWPQWTLDETRDWRITQPPAPKPFCKPAAEIDITFGPHNWHYEMQPRLIQLQHAWGFIRSPLEELVDEHWAEFAAPNYPLPESAGYDFTEYDRDQQHGPNTPGRSFR